MNIINKEVFMTPIELSTVVVLLAVAGVFCIFSKIQPLMCAGALLILFDAVIVLNIHP
jgi:hypothetical protein